MVIPAEMGEILPLVLAWWLRPGEPARTATIILALVAQSLRVPGRPGLPVVLAVLAVPPTVAAAVAAVRRLPRPTAWPVLLVVPARAVRAVPVLVLVELVAQSIIPGKTA
jgi:hypothetical protein